MDPIFVLGCPRSGTTLMATLLEPTSYGAPVETHFITKYFKKLDSYGDLDQRENFCRLVNAILRERAVMQWKLNVTADQLFNELESHTFREIVDIILMKRFAPLGKVTWGDKTPHYIIDLDVLATVFPDSKFIFIVRDGRDVALSLLKKSWGPNNVYACADVWAMYNKEGPEVSTLQESDQLFRTSYETLLQEPEDTIRRLYEFIGESLDPEKLDELIASFKRANFGKWRKRMSKNDVKVFEAVAGDTLNRLGYDVVNPQARLSSYQKSFYRLQDRFFFWVHLIKLNTIDWFRIKYMGMDPFGD